LWLERADAQNQIVESNKKLLVIVIDGIDRHKNSQESYDWLPIDAPGTVKLIYTCNKDSSGYKYLKKQPITEIYLEYPDPTNKFGLTLHFSEYYSNEKTDKVAKDIKKYGITQNALYIKFLYSILFTETKHLPKIEILSLESYRTVFSLFEYTLRILSNYSHDPGEVYKVLGYLAISSSGLSENELNLLLGSPLHLKSFLRFFSCILFKHQNRYLLSNNCFKDFVITNYFPHPYVQHREIVGVLTNTNSFSIQDILYHIFKSKDFTKLMNYISQINVFSEMFQPKNRFLLFFYWSCLEKQKFDPVECYNKSLENFSSVNQLFPQDLCILIVLLSVFFKEYSDFDNAELYKFKHPSLIGYNELIQIDLLDELLWLGGMFEQSFSLNDKEVIISKNSIARKKFKEKILADMKNKAYEIKNKQYYKYKRWLWIQFPWCALDIHSNFSQILKALEEEPEKHSKDLMDSIYRILENSGEIYSGFKFKHHKYKYHVRNNSTIAYQAKKLKLYSLTNNNSSMYIEDSMNNTVPDKLQSYSTCSIKVPEVLHSISFSGLKPENALEHVQKNFFKFSRMKINTKIKENHALQKLFNEKVYEYGLKKIKFESISSQIENSNTQIRAQELTYRKIGVLQEKLKEMCKKINLIETETSRYNQILDTCLKNPSRNDEWERKLNRKIDSIKKMTEYEKKDIEIHEKDLESINTQIKDFERLSKEKLNSQNKTLNKVLEQFLIKSNLNEQLINRDSKRLEIISTTYTPIKSNKLNFKAHETIIKKLKRFKKLVYQKNEEYIKIIKKISQIGDITDPKDLPIIILRINNKEELYEQRQKIEEKLERLENERKTLTYKLEYLKNREKEYFFVDPNEKIECLSNLYRKAEKRKENLLKLIVKQEAIITNYEGFIWKICNRLEMPQNFTFTPRNYSFIIAKIIERVLFMGKSILASKIEAKSDSVSSSDSGYLDTTLISSQAIQ
jgi:hypothetical protein